MRDDKKGKNTYRGLGNRDIMDKFGDRMSSVFSRKSRSRDKDDDMLAAFSGRGHDDYELYVDERAERRKAEKLEKSERAAKKKEKPKKPVTPLMRKIRNIITSCVIVAVVLIICVVLSLTVLFKTQNYEITGNTMYDEAELIDTCGIGKNENIFLANKRAAQKRLIKNYAYIEEVDVSFDIPDTITIDITQAVPSYIVKESDSNFFVCSTKGRILEKVNSKENYDLPIFLGGNLVYGEVGDYIEYEDKNTLEIINSIVTVFTDNGYTGITEIDATDTGNITFTYDNRIKVKLGLPEEISYKVRTAMTIIIEKLDPNGTNTTEGELDVSNCYETKKSYFREQSLIDAQTETVAPTEEETTAYVDNDYDGYDDYTGEIIEQPEPTEEETEAPVSQDDWYI